MKNIISYLFFVYFLCWTNISSAQGLCNGNLGENIFLDGNFGSATANIPSTDPKIAPGYNYTSITPPPDGSYTITNNMTKWINSYDTWISISDNSSDPNGYMMVVNASYTPGVFYEKTINGLCENTIYEFSADIINIVKLSAQGHSLPEVDFLINDELKYSSGKIAQDNKWKKYGFTFTLQSGENSVKLTLINKAPGGRGNDLALDNITFRPCGASSNIQIDISSPYIACENEFAPVQLSSNVDTDQSVYQWQQSVDKGITWLSVGSINQANLFHDEFIAGEYNYRFIAAGSEINLANEKCRTISDIQMLTIAEVQFTLRDTFCEGSIYWFKDQALQSAGTYIDTFQAQSGCDSIVTLELIEISRKEIQVEWENRDPLCHNTEDGSLTAIQVSGGYPPYQYQVNDLMESASGRFEGLSAGDYLTRIEDRFGCDAEDQHTLLNPQIQQLTTLRDTTVVLGESIVLQLASNLPMEQVIWTPDLTSICGQCIDYPLLPTESTAFSVTVLSPNQCSITKEFLVTVDKDNLPFGIPNAFSPNGDNVNDIFTFNAPQNLVQRIVSMQIYDRWGNRVYSSPDINTFAGWDGYVEQHLAPADLYTYLLEVEYIDGKIYHHNGHIQLIR